MAPTPTALTKGSATCSSANSVKNTRNGPGDASTVDPSDTGTWVVSLGVQTIIRQPIFINTVNDVIKWLDGTVGIAGEPMNEWQHFAALYNDPLFDWNEVLQYVMRDWGRSAGGRPGTDIFVTAFDGR